MRVSERQETQSSSRDTIARRVAIGGAIGGLPGLLLALGPLVLADLDVITADQSQIGFVGVPLMVIGIFVGAVVAAAGSPATAAVAGGVALGFFAGVVIGGTLAANRVLPVLLPVIVPLAMIAGGALGARIGTRDGAD